MYYNKRAVNLHVIHGSFLFSSAPGKPFLLLRQYRTVDLRDYGLKDGLR